MSNAASAKAATQSTLQIEEDGDRLVIRISKSLANRDRVERFLACLELEELASRSQLTEEAARELAEEIDRAVWEKNRHRVSAAR
ncbi:MAG TPA: hypothetical protein VHG08_25545 [Longimicrobium sp.]|nr:hypothetical protein [Longimicrobium sp.]